MIHYFNERHKHRMKKIFYLILLVCLVGFDQFTKHLAVTYLKDQDSFSLIPDVLQFHYHENSGAAWGLLSGKIDFLLIFTFSILCILIYILFKIPSEKKYFYLRVILIFIISGAIGNFIDRILNHYVVDFIYFELINFPIFNMADCYVTISTVLLMLLGILYYKEEDFDFIFQLKRKNKES